MTKRLLKYEYPFLSKDEPNTYSFLASEDPYDITTDERLRHRWVEEAKILYGDFRPSGPQKPIQNIGKSRLGEIVDIIKKLLLSDWNDVNFVIGSKEP